MIDSNDSIKVQKKNLSSLAAKVGLGALVCAGIVLGGIFARIPTAHAQAETHSTATKSAISTKTPASAQNLAWQDLKKLNVNFH